MGDSIPPQNDEEYIYRTHFAFNASYVLESLPPLPI